MKAFEEVQYLRKDFVFEYYSRIVKDFKDYEKITRKKMIQEIYTVYQDPKNIIDICTTRELKFLQTCLDGEADLKQGKYAWERNQLHDKFLISNVPEPAIYEELYDKVKEALDLVDWQSASDKDEINEFLVPYCKIQGCCFIFSVVSLASALLHRTEEEIVNHIRGNLLFNYYAYLTVENIEGTDQETLVATFNDFYSIKDELLEQRAKYKVSASMDFNFNDFASLFYNDFNMNNEKIRNFYEELIKLPFFYTSAISVIQEYALLNYDRSSLKKAISDVPNLQKYDLTDFFKLMDEAMDEMPSGALNGLTPNEFKKIKAEEKEFTDRKNRNYVKQQNACLNKKDVLLFYKLYFGLLDFTNQKFKIKPNYKIYKRLGINPQEIIDVVEKFWVEKNNVVTEFCMINPFKFNADELNLVQEFKKGFSGMMVLANYEKEYTAVIYKDKTYMIKGLNANIDEIIGYEELPKFITTAIIPFKGKLVYDGIISSFAISAGLGLKKMVENEYQTSLKFYHL